MHKTPESAHRKKTSFNVLQTYNKQLSIKLNIGVKILLLGLKPTDISEKISLKAFVYF